MIPTLDDCTRLELRALKRLMTPLQIAGAKARLAREEASAAKARMRDASVEAILAIRAVKARFAAHGADEEHKRLFEIALLRVQASRAAEKPWLKAERLAQAAEREFLRLNREARDGDDA